MGKHMIGRLVLLSCVATFLCSIALAGCGAQDDTGMNTPTTQSEATTINQQNTTGANVQEHDVADNRKIDIKPTIKSTVTKQAVTSKATDTRAIEKDIFSRVNKERKKAGKSTLKWSDSLYKACAVRAKEVTTRFSHTRPNNSSCFTAITQSGISYRSAAENIASGQTSAEQVMKSWMQSAGHKKNILSNNTTFACAVISNTSGGKSKGYSFVQLFCIPK